MLSKIFKKLEESLFTGKMIKDYGTIRKHKWGIVNIEYKSALTMKKSVKQFVVMHIQKNLLGWSKRYLFFDKESLVKLREIIDDSLKDM